MIVIPDELISEEVLNSWIRPFNHSARRVPAMAGHVRGELQHVIVCVDGIELPIEATTFDRLHLEISTVDCSCQVPTKENASSDVRLNESLHDGDVVSLKAN